MRRQDRLLGVLARHWRWLIVGLVVVLVASYVVWSYSAWTGVDKKSQSSSRKISAIAQQLARQTTSRRDRSLLQSSTIDTLCQVPSLINWQQRVISSLEKIIDRCQKQQQSLKKELAALQRYDDWLKSADALTDAMTELADELKVLKPADFSAQRQAWQTAMAAMSDTSVTGAAAQKVKAAMNDNAQAVLDAYDALIKANAVKDTEAFDAAQNKLEKSYESFAHQSIVISDSYEVLQKPLLD